MKPLSLNPTIGVVALSSPTKESDRIPLAIKRLESLGCRVIVGDTVYAQDGYRSASITDRVRDLERMFANPSIELILNTTGGYNSNELLEFLPWDVIYSNPKWFVGYSDITALNLAMTARAGIPTVQGPMLIDDKDDPTALERLLKALRSDTADWSFPAELYESADGKRRSYDGLRFLPGKKDAGVGPIVAGNVSTFALLLGTNYLPDFTGVVLCLEFDKCEDKALPSLQRFLWQFRQAGLFDRLDGFVFGAPQADVATEETNEWGTREILIEVFQGLEFPVVYNAPFGHIYPSWVLINGMRISIETSKENILFST